jgi:hypothetical protein
MHGQVIDIVFAGLENAWFRGGWSPSMGLAPRLFLGE